MIAWINETGSAWAETAVWAVIQNTVFLGLIVLLLHRLRNLPARIRFIVGFAGLIKLVVPPFIPAPFLIQRPASLSGSIGELMPADSGPAAASMNIRPGLEPAGCLFLAWLAGLFLFILIPVLAHIRLRWKLASSACGGEKDAENAVEICKCSNLSVPLTFGLFRKRIYVPEIWDAWPPETRGMILRHEMAHLRRRDGLSHLIQVLAQALYFFHPLAWHVSRKCSELREMACDDLSTGNNKTLSVEYSRALVQIAENLARGPDCFPASALIRQKNELLNRIRYQMEGAMKSISGGKTVLILAGLLMTAVPLSWTRARPQNEQTPPPMEQKEGMNPMFLFMSMPDGGTEAILKNLVYPESARKLGVEGEVTVRVQYTEKGFKDAAIEKSEFNVGGKGKEYELAAKECGEAALKAVRSVTWTPIKGASSAGGSFMIPLKFKLDQKKEKAPAVSGKIYGSVKDVGGKPLEGAAIAIEGTEFKAFSDASGNFFIIQVPPGEYDLKAVKPGYESISLQAVKISVGKNTHFDILLKEIPAPDEEAAPPPPPAPPPLPAPEGNSFVPFDTAPEPVEGYAVIQKNVVYPELAVKAGVEGVVIVQADIDENGNVTGTKIQQSLGANGCDESAVNAIRSVQWKPAQKDGRPVAVSVYIPVDFKMGKK